MTLSARTLSRATLVVATASFLALAACSGESGGEASSSSSPSITPSSSASPSSTIIASPDLSGVTVTEDDMPTITVAAPWGISETQTKVLRESSSQQVLTDTSTVTVNYVGVNGTTGEVFDSSFQNGAPASLTLDGGVIPGFSKGLVGQRVGSRVLIGIAPADGYVQGTQDGRISPGDSLLFAIDILSANFEEVTGEEVPPAEGLPSVTVGDSGPEITLVEGAAPPTELVVQPLVKGPGVAVTEASTLEVKYRAWNMADGTLVKDGWTKQSGVLANLIQGWRDGLVGQSAGSRVMLIVPPELAYPNGDPTMELKPGQTLIYVIDLLDVRG